MFLKKGLVRKTCLVRSREVVSGTQEGVWALERKTGLSLNPGSASCVHLSLFRASCSSVPRCTVGMMLLYTVGMGVK